MYSNGFILILIPLNYLQPPKIIHIEISDNDFMDHITEYFKEFLSQINIILFLIKLMEIDE